MSRDQHTSAGQSNHGDELSPVVDFLRRHPPFDRMERQDVQKMALRLELKHYPTGTRVVEPGSGPAARLFIVHKGRVRGGVADEPHAADSDTWELMPGECFPVGALLSRRPVRTVHEAAEDTECFELEWEDFNELLETSRVFNDFSTHRLSVLLNSMKREVQADALRGLGGDTSLNITLGERLRRPPVTCEADTPVRTALERMQERHVGSIVVTDDRARPLGVFTLRDLLTRVSIPGASLDLPMQDVMTPNPVCIPRSSFAFEAAMIMADKAIHHICVVDRGRLVGVISERDLFSMQRVGLVNLSKSIARADSVRELARLRDDIHQLVDQMIAQGARVGQITQIITLLNDQITRRILELCTRDAEDLPAVSYSWIAFGSEARQEQTLKTDQDNGVIFRTPEGSTPDEVRAALTPFFRQVNEALDQCGYPLCKGNIMASNPECCLSLEEWQQRFTRWIEQGTPKHLLQASIFFDFRTIDGSTEDAERLRHWLLDKTAGNSRFRRQLAANALQLRPPLGLFRSFRVSSRGEYRNTLNLKLNGVTPFVDAARILALAHRLPAINTMERLRMAAEARIVDPGDVAAWSEAYDYIQMLRMRKNQQQRAAGEPLSNRVDPSELNDLDRRILKEAFREARTLQNRIESDYQL
ncbi:DUF294 nucleotidyltransferase-like domain-containing protein [Aquisalimonas sp.]|uniref:DUF294 nucleotidyltransferase-like domain-containing protein n=1 Tax=unclassified Aquisalimonas TaxID=2644645 RepID=UPI0025C13383|nr:DUF294 nucleotidyltransferase-like domain-containing protein [Aquisalimonas sp.]